MAYQVIIPAAGKGNEWRRKNKLLLEIDRVPILIYTLRVFEFDEMCEGIILAINEEEKEEIESLLMQYGIKKQ